jgi:Mlc titration factor MtfA (ptsG expression regulator)
VREQPFPQFWIEVLEHCVPYYRYLDENDRIELRQHILVFLDEKRFEGCGGLTITDEIRVSIAAQACLLLLHRKTDYYPTMNTILVYPEAYVVRVKRQGPGGMIEERDEVRLGESWHRGEVVLSWDDVKKGAYTVNDGLNVVLHEFAHQLDALDGVTDGAPVLPKRAMYADWSRVFSGEYEQLAQDLMRNQPTLLREYATTNPAEFFAVTTEVFFEKPLALRRKHPELYEQMSAFYQQDPASRFSPDNEN